VAWAACRRCCHRQGGARWLYDRHERHRSVGDRAVHGPQYAFEDKDLVLLTPIALVQMIVATSSRLPVMSVPN